MAERTNFSGRTLSRAIRKSNASQTPGKKKGENCKADSIDRYMAKANRSYKHPLYIAWYMRKDGNKKGGSVFVLA